MLGGLFLCYEGFEKKAHKYLHSKDEDQQHHDQFKSAVQNHEVEMIAALFTNKFLKLLLIIISVVIYQY